jgi:hypothetical protein
MVETIRHAGELIAIIVKGGFEKEGISFLSPQDSPLQLGFMRHPAGKIVDAHVHNKVERRITSTAEAIFVQSGEVRVDFYDDDKRYLESRTLVGGDVTLLLGGGHGLVVLEDSMMFEVKQGPYLGELDKVRFKGVEPGKVKIGGDASGGGS